jgi:hypothetical protein
MVRTDRHDHPLVAGGSEGVEAIKVLARAHQSMADIQAALRYPNSRPRLLSPMPWTPR